jgi:hypothetical protein
MATSDLLHVLTALAKSPLKKNALEQENFSCVCWDLNLNSSVLQREAYLSAERAFLKYFRRAYKITKKDYYFRHIRLSGRPH